MEELFCDLIAAALRHRRPDVEPVLTVTAADGEDMWLIRVEDNGAGLDDRDPERMFDLLIHDADGGMSVGLAPARLTAFMLGGRLWAQPGHDGGVVLCLEIPAVRGTLPPQPPGA
jgi:signal transduction histidine kinase